MCSTHFKKKECPPLVYELNHVPKCPKYLSTLQGCRKVLKSDGGEHPFAVPFLTSLLNMDASCQEWWHVLNVLVNSTNVQIFK